MAARTDIVDFLLGHAVDIDATDKVRDVATGNPSCQYIANEATV